jgi:hypothetical protein
MPIDVQKIGCHMLAATSRKYLRGPRGMGFLYVERSLCQNLEPVFLDLHAASLLTSDTFEIRADARRFENWECNVAAKLGLGAAVQYALAQGVDPMWLRIQQLAGYLRQRLADIPGVTPRDVGSLTSGIVTFTHQGSSAAGSTVAGGTGQAHQRVDLDLPFDLDRYAAQGLAGGQSRFASCLQHRSGNRHDDRRTELSAGRLTGIPIGACVAAGLQPELGILLNCIKLQP